MNHRIGNNLRSKNRDRALWASRASAQRGLRSLNMRCSRTGITYAEVTVALTLMLIAVAGVGRLSQIARAGLRDRELHTRFHWELKNARETIGTWPIDDVNVPNIEGRDFTNEFRGVQDLHWQASVTDIEAPIHGKQIELKLICTYKGQSAEPASLVFWVPDDSAAAPDAEESPDAEAAQE